MRIRHLALAGLTAVLLTACGGDGGNDDAAADRTGPEVAADAADALAEAGAVHVTGTIGTGAEEQTVDLRLQGEDAVGSVGVAGQELQLLRTAGVVYVQAPAEFWTTSGIPPEAAATIDGVWVVLPVEQSSGFEDLSLDGVADSLRTPTDGKIKPEVKSEKLDGEDVLVVTQDDGSTLTVADDDPAYPLKIENEGADGGALTFDDFGEEETITAPPNPVDASQVGA